MNRPESRVSVQLYTVRAAIADDLHGALGRIASLGYTNVEPYAFAERATDFRAAFDEFGLSAPSGHAKLLDKDVRPIFDAAVALGIGTVIDPYLPEQHWTTKDDIASTAAKLNAIAAVAADYGLTLGYHNHAWELENRFGGVTALEVLASDLDPAVVLEVDTYWTAVGGEPVPGLLRRLGDRVQLLHIKDGDISKNNLAQTAVGNGRMPVAEIIAAAAPTALLVVELDDFAGDVFDALGESRPVVAALA